MAAPRRTPIIATAVAMETVTMETMVPLAQITRQEVSVIRAVPIVRRSPVVAVALPFRATVYQAAEERRSGPAAACFRIAV